jgi:hypothetical protein
MIKVVFEYCIPWSKNKAIFKEQVLVSHVIEYWKYIYCIPCFQRMKLHPDMTVSESPEVVRLPVWRDTNLTGASPVKLTFIKQLL